jgi:hypothetical protein
VTRTSEDVLFAGIVYDFVWLRCAALRGEFCYEEPGAVSQYGNSNSQKQPSNDNLRFLSTSGDKERLLNYHRPPFGDYR